MHSSVIVSLIFLASPLANVANCLDQDAVNSEIMSKIQALENKDREHTRMLEQYRTDLFNLQAVVESQAKRLQHQDTLLRRYANRVNRLEQKLTRMNPNQADTKQTHDDELEAAADEVAHDNIRVHTLTGIQEGGANKGRVNRAERIQRRSVSWSPVYFHAVITSNNAQVTDGQSVVFPHVVASAGGGYDVTTGIFTATKAGVYIISLTVSQYPGHFIIVEIVQDGHTLARAAGDAYTSNYDQGSVTVPAMLEVGEAVWAKVHSSDNDLIYGYWESSFMALLVNPS